MALQQQFLKGISHYYLCQYKPLTAGFDKLSRSLLRFKAGSIMDVDAWCSCAVEELNTLVLPHQVLVVRALTSSEITAQENIGLDTLGLQLQQELKFHYLPDMLFKTMHTRPLKQLSRKERQAELTNIYRFEASLNWVWSTILTLDDILTTGTTLQAIAACIRQQLPAINIIGFTLAASEKAAPINTRISLQSNTYRWQNPGGWIVQESDPDYISPEALKKAIRNKFQPG